MSHSFQVSTNSGEPFTSKFARNLLAKDDWRTALRDEAVEDRPEVAFVGGAELLSGCAEWLARATSGPNRSSCRPAGEFEGEAPSADSGEEVALGVS